MKRILIAIFILTGLTLAACGAPNAVQPQPPSDGDAVRDAGGVGGAPPSLVVVPGSGFAGESTGSGGDYFAPEEQGVPNNQAAVDRLVIKNATLSIVVDNPAVTVDAITQIAEGMGGFVVTLNTYESYFGPDSVLAQQANMTVRVPSTQLNEAIRQIKGMAVEVKNESVSGQDVTSEYTDLQSRLTNLEAAEKQLQSIMAEATKTTDVLTVYNELVRVREQIEVIKGQMKYYEQSASFSAITLDIVPNVAAQPIEVGGWHPEGTVKEAIEDMVRFLQNLTDGLIYFSIARLPFLIVIGVPALLIGRWAWRRMKKTAPKPAQAGTD
jgi:hypothetical protein